MNIKIDPEFKALIPPLAPEELAQLEANLIADGCRDPLVTWRGILLDGHNRHAICTRLHIPFETVEIQLSGRIEARVWIRSLSMGRRNLSDGWRIELQLGNKADLLEMWNKSKCAKLTENQNAAKDKPKKTDVSNNDTSVSTSGQTRQAIAKASGFSTGKIAQAEVVKKKSPELWEKVKNDELTVGAAYKSATVHVGQNSGENEWYTPPCFIESARLVMGSIDIDPASSDIANKTVMAKKFFTKDDDGLKQKWAGNVWMNPPYAQPLITNFAEAITYKFQNGETKQAVVLVNNGTETQWWQRMAGAASAVCFPKSRVRFLDPAGNPGAPLQGQSILYFGSNVVQFAAEFQQYGKVFA